MSAVAVRTKATPELIREGVRIAVECGVNEVTLEHYDGAEFPMLGAIRESLAAAAVAPARAKNGSEHSFIPVRFIEPPVNRRLKNSTEKGLSLATFPMLLRQPGES